MKLLGLVLLVLAAGLFGWFGLATPLGAAIFQIAPAFLNTLQAGVQRNLSPWLWDAVFLPVLEWPAWLIPLALGALLVVLGPGRRRDG
jgi:hypothetical protein